jgi:hypothetical protein
LPATLLVAYVMALVIFATRTSVNDFDYIKSGHYHSPSVARHTNIAPHFPGQSPVPVL